jgi:hypothetical protein
MVHSEDVTAFFTSLRCLKLAMMFLFPGWLSMKLKLGNEILDVLPTPNVGLPSLDLVEDLLVCVDLLYVEMREFWCRVVVVS